MEYKSPQINDLDSQLYCDVELGASVDQPIEPGDQPWS